MTTQLSAKECGEYNGALFLRSLRSFAVNNPLEFEGLIINRKRTQRIEKHGVRILFLPRSFVVNKPL